MKFRKKPVVIDAEQLTLDRIKEFMFDNVPLPDGVHFAGGSYHRERGEVHSFNAYIETLEGRMLVTQDDWIITGVKGEFYPCKPDIFAATYEQVDP